MLKLYLNILEGMVANYNYCYTVKFKQIMQNFQ